MASRCLYYYESGRQVSFSTLSSAILQVFPEIPENPLFFKDFLTAPGLAPNISPEDTPYRGMYKLKPGTYLEITSHGITEHTYWTPADEASPFSCGSFSAAPVRAGPSGSYTVIVSGMLCAVTAKSESA